MQILTYLENTKNFHAEIIKQFFEMKKKKNTVTISNCFLNSLKFKKKES